MIQLTALSIPGTIDVPRPGGAAASMTSDFALALATIAAPTAGRPVVVGKPSPPSATLFVAELAKPEADPGDAADRSTTPIGRQDRAAPGKTMPVSELKPLPLVEDTPEEPAPRIATSSSEHAQAVPAKMKRGRKSADDASRVEPQSAAAVTLATSDKQPKPAIAEVAPTPARRTRERVAEAEPQPQPSSPMLPLESAPTPQLEATDEHARARPILPHEALLPPDAPMQPLPDIAPLMVAPLVRHDLPFVDVPIAAPAVMLAAAVAGVRAPQDLPAAPRTQAGPAPTADLLEVAVPAPDLEPVAVGAENAVDARAPVPPASPPRSRPIEALIRDAVETQASAPVITTAQRLDARPTPVAGARVARDRALPAEQAPIPAPPPRVAIGRTPSVEQRDRPVVTVEAPLPQRAPVTVERFASSVAVDPPRSVPGQAAVSQQPSVVTSEPTLPADALPADDAAVLQAPTPVTNAAPATRAATISTPEPTLQMAMADTTPDAPVQSAPAAPALPVPSLAAQTPVARAAPSAIRQPASEVFAAAMFAADRPAPRASVHRSEMGELLALSTPATAPLTVQATGTAGQPALDTRQHDWPAAMIERIEVLRDAVETNVRETRIRLVPDALGPIDVSIRQDGDTTNVRLTAETPQARAMLAEAAPRLTELADARGLKLAQAGVETGAGGFAGRHAQQQPDQPARPASARTAEAVEDDADHRIA